MIVLCIDPGLHNFAYVVAKIRSGSIEILEWTLKDMIPGLNGMTASTSELTTLLDKSLLELLRRLDKVHSLDRIILEAVLQRPPKSRIRDLLFRVQTTIETYYKVRRSDRVQNVLLIQASALKKRFKICKGNHADNKARAVETCLEILYANHDLNVHKLDDLADCYLLLYYYMVAKLHWDVPKEFTPSF